MPIASHEEYYNAFVQSPSGRNVLKDMLAAHYHNASSFSPDPYQTAFNEGERNVVLRILTILNQYEKEEKVDGKISDG